MNRAIGQVPQETLAESGQPVARWGHVTIDSWRAHNAATGEHLHTFLNDVDVSDACREANDIEGWALLSTHPAHIYRDVVMPLQARGLAHFEGQHWLRCRGDVVILSMPEHAA